MFDAVTHNTVILNPHESSERNQKGFKVKI